MGRSPVDYLGRGFFSADAHVQLLLAFLCDGIDRMPEQPDWVRQMRVDWRKEATNGNRGMVGLHLDAHLGLDPDRVDFVLALLDQVRERLEAYGETVPKDVINNFGTGVYGDAPEFRHYNNDVSTDFIIGDINSLDAVLRDEHVYGPYSWNIPRRWYDEINRERPTGTWFGRWWRRVTAGR